MSIGQRIKRLRMQRGLSIDELAIRLGKNRTTIYRYENGDIENLPLNILNPLAEALDTTPAFLLGWATDERISARMTEGDDEYFILSPDKTYIRRVEMWYDQFGMNTFTDEEYAKLFEYGKFLLSIREK